MGIITNLLYSETALGMSALSVSGAGV